MNPYPYVNKCDIVSHRDMKEKQVTVSTNSRKPVIITDFPTSQSQLCHNFDGWITPNGVRWNSERYKGNDRGYRTKEAINDEYDESGLWKRR